MKSIFVTGATSGFGLAIAQRFAENGYNIIISGRREERLARISEELRTAHGVTVTPLAFDIRNKAEVIAAVAQLADARVDVLVNNAGLAAGLSTIDAGDTDDWDQMIDTNVKGLLYVTRAISPGMVRRGEGHIINIGSTAGKLVYKNGNVYCATKFRGGCADASDARRPSAPSYKSDGYQSGHGQKPSFHWCVLKATRLAPGMFTTASSRYTLRISPMPPGIALPFRHMCASTTLQLPASPRPMDFIQ